MTVNFIGNRSRKAREAERRGRESGWVDDGGESCLDNQASRKLTLSQRLGLVPCPAPPLTSDEWEKVREKARERGDTESDCMICLEPFGNDDGGQVGGNG